MSTFFPSASPNVILGTAILGGITAALAYKQWTRTQTNKTLGVDNYAAVRAKLLENSKHLDKSVLPPLWIYVPHEVNSREWVSFGSRNTTNLNQPYLSITLQSILDRCGQDFNICLIDDHAFPELLENWTIDVATLPDPVCSHMRTLAIVKLLRRFGGMVAPISFACRRSLRPYYEKWTEGGRMFACEAPNDSISATQHPLIANTGFMGAPKACNTILQFEEFLQRTISRDFTAQLDFMGDADRWCAQHLRGAAGMVVRGEEVGTAAADGSPICIEDLISDAPIQLAPNAAGLWVPAEAILQRHLARWFVFLSPEEAMHSSAALSAVLKSVHIRLNERPAEMPALVGAGPTPAWVGFWRTPLLINDTGLFGLRPSVLGGDAVKNTGR